MLFVPDKPYQPSLTFVDKARSLSLSGTPDRKSPSSLANIRLGWKGLPSTNTLTDFVSCGRKKCYTFGHSSTTKGWNVTYK